jgi:hypothetical protein
MKCLCGCGENTNLAKQTDISKGWVKGVPLKYLQYHKRLSSVDYIINQNTGCWEWQRHIGNSGYALFTPKGMSKNNRKTMLAHRYFYEKNKGPIPEDYVLDHLCGVRRCVNPNHLEIVTQKENCRRGKGAKLSSSTVLKIKNLLKFCQPGGQRKIAEKFSVSQQLISAIKHNRAWGEM